MSNNYTSAYYALLKAGANDDYYKAIMSLVLYAIKYKHYDYIDVNCLCDDFYKTIGFKIHRLVMEDLLNKAYNEGYLEYNKTVKKYEPKYHLIQSNPIMQEIVEERNRHKAFIEDFINYSKTHLGETLTLSDAEKIVGSFIEEQGMLLYHERENYFNDSHDEYDFAKYLEFLVETNVESFKYVNELIVGRILAEFVLYDQSDAKVFEDLTVYLDTGFVFRLLGIDSLDRQSAYKELLEQMQELGIKTKIFPHTFNEISLIISNSIQWIDNPEYSSLESSETTDFFVRERFTKEDIQEYIDFLPEKLKENDIEVIELDYPQAYPMSVTSETEYYSAIVNHYKDGNPTFDEEEKRQTVENDARSFFYVDYLSGGMVSQSISQAKNLFLTTNYALACVSRNINKAHGRSIPFCITDRFMAVTLWKNSPEKLVGDSYNRLLIAIKSAFMPNETMLERFSKALQEIEEAGELSKDQCILLKTSIMAHRYLMELTKGDYNLITEKTPFEILQEMHRDAKNEGASEERKKANKEIEELSTDYEERIKNQVRDNEELRLSNVKKDIEICEKNIELTKTKIEKKEGEIKSFDFVLNGIDEDAKKYRKVLGFAFAGVIFLYILIGVILWIASKNVDVLEVYEFISTPAILVFSYIYFAVTGKDLNIFKWMDNVVQKRKEKLYMQNGVDINDGKRIMQEITGLNNQLNGYEDELTRLKS